MNELVSQCSARDWQTIYEPQTTPMQEKPKSHRRDLTIIKRARSAPKLGAFKYKWAADGA